MRGKRQETQRAGPGFILALMALAALTLAACAGDKEALAQVTFAGGPRLQVDRTAWDLGNVPAGKAVDVVFNLTNVGDSPLVIENAYARVVEGCCPPPAKLGTTKLKPGATTTLDFRYSMGTSMVGPHAFDVVVATNDAVEPEIHLILKGVSLGE